ncbi:MAG: UdgX family uracil-DNA binding protein [Pseudomonadota bacterium]
MRNIYIKDFEDWRMQTRLLLANDMSPRNVNLQDVRIAQNELWNTQLPLENIALDLSVPREFIDLAKRVACHRDTEKWNLLYAVLWRIGQGEKHVLEIVTDPLVHRLRMMTQAVGRDAHKAKAFVRFRKTEDDEGELYIAWHRPDHLVLPLVAKFFQERFAIMRFLIMTPDQSLLWDGKNLHWLDGVPRDTAPRDEEMEELWRTYYRSIFNPARIKLNMMKREMPVRHWRTLPETWDMPAMLAEAPQRVEEMVKRQKDMTGSAEDFIPGNPTLQNMREAIETCRGCELYKDATQPVFGEGAKKAKLMLVGEQPGDQEDITGHPFVGPAGNVLDRALEEAGINRDEVYVTNAVKHFKFRMAGKRRQHRSPLVKEVNACKPWLTHEIAAVQPDIILCLGVTAARALLGPGFTLKEGRGRWQRLGTSEISATYHPSAVLRGIDADDKEAIYRALVDDLKEALVRLKALA